jgi:phosphoribosylglycinamide formyltransferase-1
MQSLIIFASGKGSNAQAIIDHFKANGQARVSLIVCNKPGAGVLDIADKEGIDSLVINRSQYIEPSFVEKLKLYKPSLIVLAGFLWKIPDEVIRSFPDRIVNIHPALLPGYGGKGMYGHHVHEAVLAANENESGITVHYVNEVYDSGRVILQARCAVHKNDSADDLAKRIHGLEHFYYPRSIEYLLKNSR